MLKFFRSIRKKQIEQDNIRKYLLYYIGEILLVLIGILIALKIHHWSGVRRLFMHKLSTCSSSDVYHLRTIHST